MMTYLNIESMPLLSAMIAAAIIVVFSAIFIARHLYKTADSRKIKRIIDKCSVANVSEVVFSNGMGGYFFIDYLVLLPGRILALNLQDKNGFVFGSENIEWWTLVGSNKSSKFKNPLEDVNLFAKYVKDQLKFDMVIARALFDSRSKFPKGVPEGVLQLASLSESMAAWAGEKSTEATSQAWDRLTTLLAESRERYNKETG